MTNNLRRVFTVALAILLFTSCKNSSVIINGTIAAKDTNTKITLNKADSIVAEVTIDKKNTFNITVNQLKKGYYQLNNKLVFLAPGYDINAEITSDSTIITSTKFNENKVLKRIEDYTTLYFKDELLKDKFNLNESDFNSYLEEYKTKVNFFLKDEKLDKDFVRIENRKASFYANSLLPDFAIRHGVNFNTLNKAMDYLDPKDPEKLKVFDSLSIAAQKDGFNKAKKNEILAKALKDFSWNDEELFLSNSLGYKKILKRKIARAAGENYSREYAVIKDFKSMPSKDVFERNIVLDSIHVKSIRDKLLKDLTSMIIKTDEKSADDAMVIYKKSNPNTKDLEEVSIIYTNLKKMQKGQPSPVFVNYKTPEDKTISLSDFKGKYVYLDILATWCAPCKKEIPYLKKVEEQFQGKNIEFVSISVDVENQRQYWKQMVSDLELVGVQIIADKDFKSDFISSYNIAAIPRFLLIDPNGNIVSSNAPRPSDPELVALFTELNI